MLDRTRRIWKLSLGYGLAAATIFFAARHLGLNAENVLDAFARLSPISLLLSMLAFTSQIIINSLAFAQLNQAFGVSIDTSILARTWAATLLAKYVPGGVWHVVGRGLLLARSGVSARITASVGITEQCLSLGLCGLISVAFLCFALDLPWWAFALVVLGAIAMVVLPAPLLRWMHQSVRADLYRRALLGYFVGMIPYTLGYFVIVAPDLPVRFVGALFAGTVAGVLAILAPGGLGIRESATSLIAPSAQPAQLLAGLLAARALIIVVEILVSVVCMRLLRARTTR